jgi:hypothetical protein
MTNTTFRGIQIGRLQLLVGLEPRPRKYRGKLPKSWLHPDDRFLGYDGYVGGEPNEWNGPKPRHDDEDGGVE